jgi:NAD(P)-dependent dehydrogenase (short-subunit alcohol dehydrogenase family)
MTGARALEGQVFFITGGAAGIGLETALQAQALGAKVAICDLDRDAVDRAVHAVGPDAAGFVVDVAEFDQVRAAFDGAIERFGRIDVVVANAGIGPPIETVLTVDPEAWDRVLAVNLFGVFNTVRAGMEQVVSNHGQFILVSSSYAFMNGVLNSSYATAKAGVEALGRSLRAELEPRGASATVAYFGWIKTALVRDAFEDPVVDRFRKEAVPTFLTRQIPVSRAGRALIEAAIDRPPRVIVPFEWKALFFLRGLIGPLVDRRFEADPQVAEIVREAEARAGRNG